MNGIREFLRGKKTYLTAIIGALGAVVAWADGSIDVIGLAGAIWAAAQACFIRAGLDNAIKKAVGE
jgi:membrane associated rhomboid family serine protease